MKMKLFTLIAAVAVLASCTNLRYTDYGKPLDFLKAKRDVVKPQGKIEQEKVLVLNESTISTTTIVTEVAQENTVETAPNTSTIAQESVALEIESTPAPVVVEKTVTPKSTSSTVRPENKRNESVATTTFSRKIEAKINNRIERILPEGVSSSNVDSDVMFIIALILAFLIPPLAVYLIEGVTGRFWLNLVLFIIGWGVGFYLFGGLAWICGLIAVVHALLIVLGVI